MSGGAVTRRDGTAPRARDGSARAILVVAHGSIVACGGCGQVAAVSFKLSYEIASGPCIKRWRWSGSSGGCQLDAADSDRRSGL